MSLNLAAMLLAFVGGVLGVLKWSLFACADLRDVVRVWEEAVAVTFLREKVK